MSQHLTWIEISKKAIWHNIKTLRKIIGNHVILAACVKANAYGHGLINTSKLLLQAGADWLCVDSIQETELLRKSGIKKPILIMGYVSKAEMPEIIKLQARVFVYDYETAKKLSNVGQQHKKIIPVHIKVDTGMSRQGILANKFKKLFNQLNKLPYLKIEGVATHFANSDEPQKPAFFKKQLKVFKHITKNINQKILFHASNSSAILLYPASHFNFVRPGLASYGYYSSPQVKKICCQKNTKLKPALSWKTKITAVKYIPQNSYVSYNCTYKTKKRTQIALLPVGYSDGLDRKLSNRGHVLIKGQPAKILGRVCMNITIVDVTHIKDVKKEDEVVIIGKQNKNEITLEQVANWANTINYEIITRLRESMPRVYI